MPQQLTIWQCEKCASQFKSSAEAIACEGMHVKTQHMKMESYVYGAKREVPLVINFSYNKADGSKVVSIYKLSGIE